MSLKYLILGRHKAGKDEAANFFKQNGYKYSGPTSMVLCNIAFYMFKNNFPVPECYKTIINKCHTVFDFYNHRHFGSMFLYDLGKFVRKWQGETFLVDLLIKDGTEIIVGLREFEETILVIEKYKPDYVLWIERDVPEDQTLEFSYEDLCEKYDKVIKIQNNKNIDNLYSQLRKFL